MKVTSIRREEPFRKCLLADIAVETADMKSRLIARDDHDFGADHRLRALCTLWGCRFRIGVTLGNQDRKIIKQK